MSPTSERAAAFAVAALVPAVLTGLYFLVAGIVAPGEAGFGPGHVMLAFLAFVIGFTLAGLHILVLAVPLHSLLSARGMPGTLSVLLSSFLIGALPLPLLSGAKTLEPYALFGLLGLTGGVAFLLVAGLPEED